MVRTSRWVALLGLLAGWSFPARCLAIPLTGQATIGFSNLSITPASGVLVMALPWTANAFGDADGMAVFDNSFDGATPASVLLASGFASASADAYPLTLAGAATSGVTIPEGVVSTSFGAGRSSLFGLFTVMGGSGEVEVAFSADIAADLAVASGPTGLFAAAESVFALELDGTPVLFRADMLSVGAGGSESSSFATTLTASVALEFGTSYFVFVEADSESKGSTVPESPTVLGNLTLLGLLVLKACLTRRNDRRSMQT